MNTLIWFWQVFNYATVTFFQRFPTEPSNLHSIVLIQSSKECVSSGLTNIQSRRFKKIYIIFGLFGQSFHVTFFSKYIDQRSRKKLLWNDYVPMCEQGNFNLKTSIGHIGKQFQTGEIKPEPRVCGSLRQVSYRKLQLFSRTFQGPH